MKLYTFCIVLIFYVNRFTSVVGYQDCYAGTLDKSNIITLISVASKSTQCYTEARNAFGRSYGNSSFFIKGPFVPDASNLNTIEEFHRSIIHIKHFNTVEILLNLFGDLIQFINISFNYIKESEGTDIIGYINSNCTHSLNQFHLNDCYGKVLEKLQTPFRNVYMVSFSTNNYRDFADSSQTTQLSKIFPNVQRLNVKVSEMKEWDLIGDTFPRLRSLSVELPEQRDVERLDIGNLFKNSRNINALTLRYGSLMILKDASNYLKSLKILDIYEIPKDSYNGELIEFKNVSSLTLTSNSDKVRIPQRLAFTQLRVLALNLGYDFTDQWITFFKNQRQKTLEFFDIDAFRFSATQLPMIAEYQPNINYAGFKSKTEVPAEGIIKFVEKSKHLQKFALQCALIDVSERDLIERRLERYWDVNFDYMERNDLVDILLMRL